MTFTKLSLLIITFCLEGLESLATHLNSHFKKIKKDKIIRIQKHLKRCKQNSNLFTSLLVDLKFITSDLNDLLWVYLQVDHM